MQSLSLHLAGFDSHHLPFIFSRPRLLGRLQGQPARGKILVQGQAAQGKTSLVADFLHHTNAKVAWLGLDNGDGDAGSFYALLVEALVSARALPRHFKSMQSVRRPTTATVDDRLRRDLKEIWKTLPEDLEIVLDGLDRLADKAPAHALVRDLCQWSETHCRLWLLSRREASFKPLLDDSRRCTLVMTNTELAFTPSETSLYFQTRHDIKPAPQWVDRVHRLTDGWCGGLVLLSRALERRNKSLEDYDNNKLLDNLPGESIGFFSQEVFKTLSEDTKLFLLQAAATDTIDPDLTEKIPGMDHAASVLKELAGNLGFVHPVFDAAGKRTFYRFTPIFHDFLRTRLAVDVSAEAQQALYTRIGLYCDRKGDLTSAVDWYLKARDFETAAAALKKIGIGLLIKGQLTPLEAWLNQMPSEQIRSEPWLFLFLTLSRRIKGQAKSIKDFQLIWDLFSGQDDVRGRMVTAAFMIEALVFQRRSAGRCLHWIKTAEQLLCNESENPFYAWPKLLLWLQIGFGYIGCGLDLAKGLSASRNAVLLARRMGDETLIFQAAVVHGLGLVAGGAYHQARDRLSGLTDPAALPCLRMYDALKGLALAEIDTRAADFAAAEEKLKSVRDDIERHGLIFLYPVCVEAAGFLQMARNQYDEARLTCRHLLDVSVLAGSTYYKALAHRLSALIHYHCERYHPLAEEADRAAGILTSQGPPTLQAMRVIQLQAMALHHLGKTDAAIQKLTLAVSYFKTTSNQLGLAETYLMMGLVHERQSAPKVFQDFLRQGFSMARSGRFDPFVFLSPADRHRACALAADGSEAIARSRSSGRQTGPKASEQNRSGEPISGGIPIAARQPGWLDIHTFGGFRVLRNGEIPIPDRQWGGIRPKLLLKALLVHGLRDIPKEIIIDNLWPESPPQAAFQNFKVTLHRLRKALEPEHKAGAAPSIIHLKDNLISLNMSRCQIDLEAFLICCKEIKRCTLGAETDRIAVLGGRLLDIYRGDFLPEEPYTPWIEMKRWALKDTFIENILIVCAIHRRQGRLKTAADCCRAAIQIDPFQERVVRELVALYIRMGRHKDARDLFEQYRSALKKELDLDPEEETLALMRDVSGTAR